MKISEKNESKIKIAIVDVVLKYNKGIRIILNTVSSIIINKPQASIQPTNFLASS